MHALDIEGDPVDGRPTFKPCRELPPAMKQCFQEAIGAVVRDGRPTLVGEKIPVETPEGASSVEPQQRVDAGVEEIQPFVPGCLRLDLDME
jgi:hypothetical protein